MLAYKGFHKGLICRNYQFSMGLNVTEKANCRVNGFHCAANPFDCLVHYPDTADSEYYLVNAEGDMDEDNWVKELDFIIKHQPEDTQMIIGLVDEGNFALPNANIITFEKNLEINLDL